MRVNRPDQPAAHPFAPIVEAHWTAVYRLLYSLAGDSHDAEDLTQETFLRALDRWRQFQAGSNVRAWLLRIASNAFFDLKRKRRRAPCQPLTTDPLTAESGPEQRLEERELGELLSAAVAELTEKARMVFHLRVTEELSFRDIADILGTSEEAARWHMHDARLKLSKRLASKS
jgi:RNA polymerase sigma-70 factor (ECF subfamily)